MATAPARLHRARVKPEWLDYNGHLNEAYYLVVFSHATDAVMDAVHLAAEDRAREKTSLYTLETHIRYLEEVGEGQEVVVDSRITALDAKRFVVFHEMRLASDERLLATAEKMMLHVDMSGPPKATPFGDQSRAALDAMHEAQIPLGPPDGAGRAVGLRKKT